MFELIYDKWSSVVKREVDKHIILMQAKGRLEGALMIFDIWIISHLLKYI